MPNKRTFRLILYKYPSKLLYKCIVRKLSVKMLLCLFVCVCFLSSNVILCHDLCDQYVCPVAEGTQRGRLRYDAIRQEATCRIRGRWIEVVAHNPGETNINKTPVINHFLFLFGFLLLYLKHLVEFHSAVLRVSQKCC